jgi:potassium efflux system protein
MKSNKIACLRSLSRRHPPGHAKARHVPLLRLSRAAVWAALCFLCLAAWCAGISAAPAPKAPAAPPAANASPAAGVAETPVPLSAIADESPAALTVLDGIIGVSAADQNVEATRQALPDLSGQVNRWLTDSGKALEQRPSLDALRELEASGRKIEDDLNARSSALHERGKTLDDQTTQVLATGTLWTDTEQTAEKASAPADTLKLCQDVLAAVKTATARVKARRTAILELQSQLGALAGKLRAGLDAVRQASAAALKTLLVRDSPPLWESQPASSPDEANSGLESPAQQAADALAYARLHADLIGSHAAVFLMLLGLLLWLRSGLREWTKEEPQLGRAAPIFDVPIATALALSFLVKGTIYASAPAGFKALLGILLLLPMVVLLRQLLDRRLHAVLYFLILFYFVGQVRTTLATLLLLNRWIFAGEMLLAAGVFRWVSATSADPAAEGGAGAVLGRWPRRLCRLAILLCGAALAAVVLGYVRLGTILGTGVLRSTYAAVFLYALVQVFAGLALIALRVRPLSISHIARQHAALVQQRICRWLAVLAFLVWLWLTLGFFELQQPMEDWLTLVLGYQLPTGTLKLTPGQLLGFGVAIWVAVLLSRLIRFFLEEEVFERVHLAAGLPYAISTILNYLVITVGVMVAFGQLGVERTQLTILAGAFSVGLGFGLQNIINNFVSGIILLFERPVKVGDVIQIGDAIGEVRRIGIRASVIGTRDGSDIIVPNGNLISNQFTNWTYSDRQRSIEIPLSITNGPDPNHVLALLKTVAAAHGATKDHPAPEVYITSLTATGTSLIVRAWISHYEDWVKTRSELYIALVEALAREEIKLA